jgi:transketolase N-terminal domain/subunit
MTKDPIVEEVRAVREQIANENHNDLAEIFATLRKLEAESDRPHVTLSPRRTESA